MRQSLIVLTLLAGGLALAACQPATTESEADETLAEAPPAPDTIPEEEPLPEGALPEDDAVMEDPPMPADPDNPMGAASPPTLPAEEPGLP